MASGIAVDRWVAAGASASLILGTVGPIVTGFIIDRTGGYPAAFALAAAVTMSGVASWLVLIPEDRALFPARTGEPTTHAASGH